MESGQNSDLWRRADVILFVAQRDMCALIFRLRSHIHTQRIFCARGYFSDTYTHCYRPQSGVWYLPIGSGCSGSGARACRGVIGGVREGEAVLRMSLASSEKNPTRLIESIKSMMVLYGSVRSTPLARRINRSLLDLPLVHGTILGHQIENAQSCARRFGLEQLDVRVLVDTESTAPLELPNQVPGVVSCNVQQDASPIRGVAGVLSDATRGMNEDDYIIVTSGAQVYLEPLDDLVHAMAKRCADVTLVSARDASPVGVWLLRVGVLRSVKQVGYVDLKEQALDAWRVEHDVRVVERPRAYVQPARSLSEYLDAVRSHQDGYQNGVTIDEDPFREDWESSFGIAEPSVQLGADAVLHDAIALNGAVVGKGAVVVRSVLCPDAIVAPGARVIDQVVTGTVRRSAS